MDQPSDIRQVKIPTVAVGLIMSVAVIVGAVTWVQTSYNGNSRYRYAAIGHAYDAERDAFIAPQPYPSWKLAPSDLSWKAPVPYPISDPVDGDPFYVWDEDTTSWVEVTPPDEPV